MREYLLKNCRLCPRKCSVDRTNAKKGFCGADDRIKIGRFGLHFWEEPSISGENGSGTVFFSHCNLGCVFCQNYPISSEYIGKYVSVSELCDIFLGLQRQNAHNINLVTPTHYIPQIADAIEEAKTKGLKIPVLYNCGGYENPEALKILDGLIDIYMPDVKYFDDKYSLKYSKAPHYFDFALSALEEMYRQVGKNEFFEDGTMKKGIIVRHMLLPGRLFDSKKILDRIYEKFGNNIYFSIMNQYTPMKNVQNFPELSKKISPKYYDALVNYAVNLGIENAYIQSEGTSSEAFIPEFFGDG